MKFRMLNEYLQQYGVLEQASTTSEIEQSEEYGVKDEYYVLSTSMLESMRS